MNVIEKLEKELLKQDIPNFRPGDTIRVHHLIVEGNKERVQIFEGVVISRSGSGVSETITVRKVSYGVGVEKIFMLNSPRITKIEIKQRGSVRRAKLYYLRNLSGKAGKIKEARQTSENEAGA